ncbi:MAG: hypothetical protein HOC18_03485 [Candidatus Marinimicrobia bacterium]|jgi:hypothetical protein|nr:hypothetical protein [Candidatus Neomarinimicrobiota bacterium]
MALNLLSTGISFTDFAHSGGMATELLDDYETGTFLPTLMTGSWNASNAGYIKIGRMCYFQGYGSGFNSTFTSSTSTATFTAPFTSAYVGSIGPFMCQKVVRGAGTWINAYMSVGATTWLSHYQFNSSTTWTSTIGTSYGSTSEVYYGNTIITNA